MNITDFQRRLNKSAGYDGVENVASPYGYYRSGISFYWLMQPAVLVANNGRNANLRARSLQPITSQKEAGTFEGGCTQANTPSKTGFGKPGVRGLANCIGSRNAGQLARVGWI